MLAHVHDAESEIGGANILTKIGPEISAPVWTGKELAGLAGDPIGQETQPFARSRIDKTQPIGKMVGKLQEVVTPARSPVDRIRIHVKSDLSKDADRPWHMMGRRHQQPSLAKVEIGRAHV